MVGTFRLVLAGAGLLLFSAQVFAQTQPFVAPKPGLRITTSGGNWHEVDSVDGSAVRALNNRLSVLTWYAACYWAPSKATMDAKVVDELWPLSPGKNVKVEAQADARKWTVEFRVLGTEAITVASGTFDTWKIEAEETALTHASKTVTHCWYAPEIGFVVKRRVEVKEGQISPSGFEVVKIDKQDHSEFRAPTPGTSFNTTAGTFRITGAAGTSLFQGSENVNTHVYWLAGIRQIKTPGDYVEKIQTQLDQLWPLKPGKTVSLDVEMPGFYPGAPLSLLRYEIRVERFEQVTVPAGTFSTFVITWDERRREHGNSFHGLQTLWFSPALGFPVKRQSQILMGVTDWPNFELRSIQAPSSS